MKGQIKNLHIKQYCPPKSGENLRLTLTWSSTKCLYVYIRNVYMLYIRNVYMCILDHTYSW